MELSKTLRAMIAAGTSLVDNPYRLGSPAWGEFIREARNLYRLGVLDDLQIEDLSLLESDVGELMGYEGETVMLMIPYENFEKPGWLYSFYFDGAEVKKIEYEAVTPS